MSADLASPPPTAERPSLCASCDFVRQIQGRRGQTYFLCRNKDIEAKYPPQPVLDCPGYVRTAVDS